MKNKVLINVLTLSILVLLSTLNEISAQENIGLKNTTTNSERNSEEINKAKTHLANLLVQNVNFIRLLVGNDNYSSVTILGVPNEIQVFDNHIEFVFKDNKNVTKHVVKLSYFDILEEKIKSKNVTSNKDDGRTVTENHLKLGNISIVISIENSFLMKSLVNNLIIIQQKLNEERFMMDEFKKIVVEYQLLKVKPTISETQRKFIIQANAFAEIMDYDEAISSYIKVLELNSTSYPEAYFNISLLLGQRNKYNAAINFMKKYLLLAPNSSDINKVKDKIKDWEIMLQN